MTVRKKRGAKLSHVGARGAARMVDVGAKPATERRARAAGEIRMSAAAWRAVRNNTAAKGDVLGVAKLAGIQAAKRTAELIPLCHPLTLTHIDVALKLVARPASVRVEATVATTAATGVEMEALTAVSVALLTVYDMVKSADKTMRIGEIRLVEKSGGRSGHFRAR
ncbi:MAG: cyclic pyranopterin monophosphate synthase MoaC [Gemmatimonadetes bacterium]|nr:cyclic pyranopterin monophosphate synthase MoaC [Gemmatimonadota bacterium]